MVECKPAAVVQGYFPGPNIDSVDIRSQLEVDILRLVEAIRPHRQPGACRPGRAGLCGVMRGNEALRFY